MKFFLLLLLLPFLSSCDKDSVVTIDAPALPSHALYWGMPMERAVMEMQKAGYVRAERTTSQAQIFIHYADNNAFWEIPATDNLLSITYHYCGDNTKWARHFWANIAGQGKAYSFGSASWTSICSNPISTSNTIITIDDAEFQKIIVSSNISYTSTLTAKYTKK